MNEEAIAETVRALNAVHGCYLALCQYYQGFWEKKSRKVMTNRASAVTEAAERSEAVLETWRKTCVKQPQSLQPSEEKV